MFQKLSDICQLAEKAKSRSIYELFSELERAEKLSTSVEDIFLDYSKQNITCDELSALVQWADNSQLSETINRMFSGDKINNTENRAVLHTALRANNTIKKAVLKEEAGEVIDTESKMAKIVDDVHDAKYYTTFVAQSGGDESRVTLAWSDACSIPAGGSWSLSSHGNCTISAKDGVDNGNATINTNTLTLNADFAVNSGRTLTITSGGTIALCASCKILFTNIWQTDQDADTFPLNATMSLQDTAPTNGKRRNTLAIPLDCDDTDADVKPTQTSYFTTQAGGGGYDYNCDSTTTKSPTEWLYDWTEDNNGNFCQCNDQLYEPLPAYLTCGSKYREAECQDGQFLGDPCGHSGGGLDPNGPYTVSCH